jgi:hypothetical protein
MTAMAQLLHRISGLKTSLSGIRQAVVFRETIETILVTEHLLEPAKNAILAAPVMYQDIEMEK